MVSEELVKILLLLLLLLEEEEEQSLAPKEPLPEPSPEPVEQTPHICTINF
jgi:hypothetical protein